MPQHPIDGPNVAPAAPPTRARFVVLAWLCLLSGVLYLDVNETSGDLVFHRDVYSLIPFPPALDFDVDLFNIYNCKSWSYKPKPNDICLFPSSVMHSADANESDQERWCLAFNVFARGTFGGLHRLSIK